VANSALAILQSLFFGKRIAQTQIHEPPIFIVGHWRSGTTLVHELLNLDDNLKSPTTYECFAPSHFLVSSWWLKPLIALVTPKTRPMDNMQHGPNRPQEDEFAICALGAPSPYSAMAFPNQPRPNQSMIDLLDATDEQLQSLAESMLFFTKSLTFTHAKRLVLKSPTHTGRIDFLRELFPGAKFLHISRDPKSVIPSTVRLWTRLDQVNGFQIPHYDQSAIETYVGETFSQMYTAFNKQTQDQDKDIYSLRYEDIVENPVECLRSFYDYFKLPGFDQMEPKIKSHMEQQANYQKNRHTLSEELLEIIQQNCTNYQTRYGYEKT
ncbi:MAG: sulfotransferase, partial [Planctomycetota bacterium]|nr:sulfotransferase [Planctomycetota bacterium]